MATLDIDIEIQKDNINLGIGIVTRNILKRFFHKGDMSQNDVDCFFNRVHDFFKKAFNYCVKWLLLDDSFIKNSVFVNFEKRNDTNLMAAKKLFNPSMWLTINLLKIHCCQIWLKKNSWINRHWARMIFQVVFGKQQNCLTAAIKWISYEVTWSHGYHILVK